MSLSSVKRFAYRLIILSLLVIGLVVLPMSPAEKRASAFVPCEECDAQYAACLDSCVDQPSACINFCEFRYNRCLRTCE